MNKWTDYVREALVTADMGKGRVIEGFTFVCGLVGEGAEYKEALIRMFGRRGSETSRNWMSAPTADVDGKLLDAVKKELGDFLWYTAALWAWAGLKDVEPLGCGDLSQLNRVLGQTTRSLSGLQNFRSVCLDSAAPVAEMFKKHLGHGKALDEKRLKDLLENCLVAAYDSAAIVGIDAGEVMDLNISKLRARFAGGGWDSGKAAAKADEATAESVKAEIAAIKPQLDQLTEAYNQHTHPSTPGPTQPPPCVGQPDAGRLADDALKARSLSQVPFGD